MARDGSETRTRLLDAAEHLFARHNVEAVTLREINERAGQRNASALHYHFGSRQGLLLALVERHQADVDAERAVLLADLPQGDGSTEPHAVVAALLQPLIDRLHTSAGRDYLRIVNQLMGPGYELPAPPALIDAMVRLDHHLRPLPTKVRTERLRSLVFATTALLADRAARIDLPSRAKTNDQPLTHDEFSAELITMATGLVLGA